MVKFQHIGALFIVSTALLMILLDPFLCAVSDFIGSPTECESMSNTDMILATVSILVSFAGFILLFVITNYFIDQKAEGLHIDIYKKEGVKPDNLIISEPDLKLACEHFSSMPHVKTINMPEQWGRTQVIKWITEQLPKAPTLGQSFSIGTGLWGHIQPLGVEFKDYPPGERRLQIIISTRNIATDLNPEQLTVIQ